MEHLPLKRLDREAREAFCSEVVARLSDLVEGEPPDDVCKRIEEMLGDCQAFQTYKATLARTIELARDCGEAGPPEPLFDNETFRACVQRVRDRLAG